MSIYLDHAATTPLHPRVLERMLPYYKEHFGNPSSIHSHGREARMAVDRARDTIASTIGASPKEIIFTSGGTEADHLALQGIARARRDKGKHIVTTRVEHKAILETCDQLEALGYEITRLPVDRRGMVRAADVEAALREDTILISVMFANNEVGTLQPIAEIGRLAAEKEILFHSDAIQAYGFEPINVKELNVDLLSVSSHKINGPKGIGALYVAENVPLSPSIVGGSQEYKRRAGTENVAGAAGFAAAAEICMREMQERRERFNRYRAVMTETWETEDLTFHVNGHPTQVLPKILNVSFPGVDTETMLMNLDMEGIAASSGSACSSGSLEVSHVLEAMGLEEPLLTSSIRFSFGLHNDEEQVRAAAEKVSEIAKRLL